MQSYKYVVIIFAFMFLFIMPFLYYGDMSYLSKINLFIDNFLIASGNFIESIVFYKIYGIPFLALWITFGATFFTVLLKLKPIGLFFHAIDVMRGKYDDPNADGVITAKQSFYIATSCSVGLGAVAGMAIAVSKGGPGAVLWVMIFGIMLSSLKFSEVLLGHKYRTVNSDGSITGGPYEYIKQVFNEINMPRLGHMMFLYYAFLILTSTLTSITMFQSNQTMRILVSNIPIIMEYKNIVSLILSAFILIAISRGLEGTKKFSAIALPIVTLFYFIISAIVLATNITNIPHTIYLIVSSAFQSDSIYGGFLGTAVTGVLRVAFTTEAGTGAAAIVHSLSKAKPVQQSAVAVIEFWVSLMVCISTGLVLVITGAYETYTLDVGGADMVGLAFATVFDGFNKMLAISVLAIMISTVVNWSVYGASAWCILLNKETLWIYYAIYVITFYAGCVTDAFDAVIQLSDALWLSTTFPNLITMYISYRFIKTNTDTYYQDYHNRKIQEAQKL